jgi:hypothetical protein
MKTGLSIMELATVLEAQAKSKKDYVADTRRLKVKDVPSADGAGALVLQGINGGDLAIRATAHGQFASSLGIPKVYYDRMLKDAPDLLATNVNAWLERQPSKKLVRTLDGNVRALLSDSYRPLDNHDLAEAVLPQLIGLEAKVMSSEVTESRMYLKAVTEKVHGDVRMGDTLQAGLVISNSEIGMGSLRLEALDYRLVCLNGMISEVSVRQAHLGRGARGADAIEDAREFFKSETRLADDRAFFLKVRDAVGSMFDQTKFNARLVKYREADQKEVTGEPEAVVEVVAKRFGFNDSERSSILKHYIKGDMSSAWGVANAITRAAQDVESYDRSYEMERLGGDVIELPASAWREIATAK